MYGIQHNNLACSGLLQTADMHSVSLKGERDAEQCWNAWLNVGIKSGSI